MRAIPNLGTYEQEFAERVPPVRCLSCGWVAIEKIDGVPLFYPPAYLLAFKISTEGMTEIKTCEFCKNNFTVL